MFSSVCVMSTTLIPKVPSAWFNFTMDSWANPGSRDLHLDLRQAITPGARGVRDLLLSALRDAVRTGRLAPGTMLPPSRSLATDLGLARNTVAEAYAELVAEGFLASRQGAGTWVVNVSGVGLPATPRGVRGVPTHNLMPGSPDVSEFPRNAWVAATPHPMGAPPPPSPRQRTRRGAADGRSPRTARASRRARRIPCPGARRAHIAGVDRDLRRGPARGRTADARRRGTDRR